LTAQQIENAKELAIIMKLKRFAGRLGKEYALFKRACPYYDTLQQAVGNEIKKHYKKRVQKIIRVIEIGCGTGGTTTIIIESDPRVRVIAIDNEKSMIEQARHNLAKYAEKGRLKIVEGDSLRILQETPADSCDVVASALTIHNFEKNYRLKLLLEAYRILKKGGLFVNSDKYLSDEKQKRKAIREWQFKQYAKLKDKRLINAWMAHDLEDEKPDRIMKEKEAIKQIAKAGFGEIKITFRKKMHATISAVKVIPS